MANEKEQKNIRYQVRKKRGWQKRKNNIEKKSVFCWFIEKEVKLQEITFPLKGFHARYRRII